MTRIRPATAADAEFLAAMLLEAANWDPGRMRPAAEVLADVHVARYLDGWKRLGDAGLVAVDAVGNPVSACWYRCLPETGPGYGWVASDVPELTIGVLPGSRGGGVGRVLLLAAVELARQQGHRRLSLSVERANRAQHLYRAVGFTTTASGRDSDTMVLELYPSAPGDTAG